MSPVQPPEGLTDEQKKAWATLYKAAKENYNISGFGEAAVEVIVRDPALCKEFLETHRRQTIQKMSDALSRANSLLDVPPEIIKKILTIPESIVWEPTYPAICINILANEFVNWG
jgi:hypothetical protein